jgi:hypothetical protein
MAAAASRGSGLLAGHQQGIARGMQAIQATALDFGAIRDAMHPRAGTDEDRPRSQQ